MEMKIPRSSPNPQPLCANKVNRGLSWIGWLKLSTKCMNWLLSWEIPEGLKFGIGRNLVTIRPTKIPPTYTLEFLLSIYGQREIQRLTMSGTILKSLHVKYIKKIQILVPPSHITEKYEKIARPLRAKIENNLKENITLSQLRDILLPKLISGKIRVPFTEDNLKVDEEGE